MQKATDSRTNESSRRFWRYISLSRLDFYPLRYGRCRFAYVIYTDIGTIGAVMLGIFVRCEKFLARKALLFLII